MKTRKIAAAFGYALAAANVTVAFLPPYDFRTPISFLVALMLTAESFKLTRRQNP